MKYLDTGALDLGPASQNDPASASVIESRLNALRNRLRDLCSAQPSLERALVELEIGRHLLALERGGEAWPFARSAFDIYLAAEEWERAIETCEVLYGSEQPGSVSALGQGIWLAVSFPVDPQLAVEMLRHVVDDTPDDSDGAAVAAAVALYVSDLRASGQQQEGLRLFSQQLLETVARRHGNVHSQEQFDAWLDRLELRDAEKLLSRLGTVVDALVADDWWLDRDRLRAKMAVH
jgi:hypothetical protein